MRNLCRPCEILAICVESCQVRHCERLKASWQSKNKKLESCGFCGFLYFIYGFMDCFTAFAMTVNRIVFARFCECRIVAIQKDYLESLDSMESLESLENFTDSVASFAILRFSKYLI